MKVTSEVVLSVMSANSKPSADGRNTYYNLAVMQNGEVANVSCDKTVHDDVLVNLRPNMIIPFRFIMATDLTYKSVKLINLLPDNNNATATDSKPDDKAGKTASK